MSLNTIHRSASKFAWCNYRQNGFADTNLIRSELTTDITLCNIMSLSEPVVLKDNIEHWDNRGMVGTGHDWATERGLIKQHIEFELTDQPATVDFLGYLLAMFFSTQTSPGVDDPANTHVYKWKSIQEQPEAWVTSFCLREADKNKIVKDVACTSLKISGEGQDRLMVGGSFVASEVEEVGEFTPDWITPASNRYLYNYSGDFEINSTSESAHLKSFDLSLESGINVDNAWRKAASASGRVYPSVWPYTTERSVKLSLSLIADNNLLSKFEDNYAMKAGGDISLVLNSEGADSDLFQLSVPNAIVTSLDETYDEEVLCINVEIEGHCTGTATSPIEIKLVNPSNDPYFPVIL